MKPAAARPFFLRGAMAGIAVTLVAGLVLGTGTPVHAAPPDKKAPTAPSALTATAVSSTSIGLAWQPATDRRGVTAYLLYRATTGGAYSEVATVDGATTSHTDNA